MSSPGDRMQGPVPATMRGRTWRSCGRQLFTLSEVCKSPKCAEYSRAWAGDHRRKLFTNLQAFDAPVVMTAATAPGADQLPWDEATRAGLGEHKRSRKRVDAPQGSDATHDQDCR